MYRAARIVYLYLSAAPVFHKPARFVCQLTADGMEQAVRESLAADVPGTRHVFREHDPASVSRGEDVNGAVRVCRT